MKASSLASPRLLSREINNNNLMIESVAAPQGSVVSGILLILNFLLLPMFFFPSGGFQIVDVTLVLTILVIFFLKRLPIDFDKKLIYRLLPFIFWAFLVNFVYYTIYKEIHDITTTIALIYGLIQLYIFTLIFLDLINKDSLIYIYLALIFTIVGCFAIKGNAEEGRIALSFNNANQLAYTSVLLMSYIMLLIQYKYNNNITNKYYFFVDILLIMIVHYFLLLCLSRAAIVVVGVMDLVLFFDIKNIKYTIFTFTIAAIGLVILLAVRPDYIKQRLSVRPMDSVMNKDTLYDRAIRPLLAHLKGMQYIYGSGAGAAWREKIQHGALQKKNLHAIEVHNTYLDVLSSYGLIGLILFLYWYIPFCWNGKNVKYGLLIMAAIAAFNNTEIGARFRFFWISMAFFLTFVYLQQSKRVSAEVKNK